MGVLGLDQDWSWVDGSREGWWRTREVHWDGFVFNFDSMFSLKTFIQRQSLGRVVSRSHWTQWRCSWSGFIIIIGRRRHLSCQLCITDCAVRNIAVSHVIMWTVMSPVWTVSSSVRTSSVVVSVSTTWTQSTIYGTSGPPRTWAVGWCPRMSGTTWTYWTSSSIWTSPPGTEALWTSAPGSPWWWS